MLVPVPVKIIVPEVETLPLTPSDKVGVVPDKICKALLLGLLSVITKAEVALPALFKVNCVFSVKLNARL